MAARYESSPHGTQQPPITLQPSQASFGAGSRGHRSRMPSREGFSLPARPSSPVTRRRPESLDDRNQHRNPPTYRHSPKSPPKRTSSVPHTFVTPPSADNPYPRTEAATRTRSTPHCRTALSSAMSRCRSSPGQETSVQALAALATSADMSRLADLCSPRSPRLRPASLNASSAGQLGAPLSPERNRPHVKHVPIASGAVIPTPSAPESPESDRTRFPWNIRLWNASLPALDPALLPDSPPKRKPETPEFSGGIEDLKPRVKSKSPPARRQRAVSECVSLGLGPAFEDDPSELATKRQSLGAVQGTPPFDAPRGPRRRSPSGTFRRRVGSGFPSLPKADGESRGGQNSPRTPPLSTLPNNFRPSGLGLAIAGITPAYRLQQLPSLTDSPLSSTSSVPSIVITPPAALTIHSPSQLCSPLGKATLHSHEDDHNSSPWFQTALDLGAHTHAEPDSSAKLFKSSSGELVPSISEPRSTSSSAADVHPKLQLELSAEARQTRHLQDETAFSAFASRIDERLSAFFEYREGADVAQIVRRARIWMLDAVGMDLSNTMPHMRLPSICLMPSLMRIRWIDCGDRKEWVPAEVAVAWYDAACNRVMEHFVSGMFAMLNDSRAPRDLAAGLALMISLLRVDMVAPDPATDTEAEETDAAPGTNPSSDILAPFGLAPSPVLLSDCFAPPSVHPDAACRSTEGNSLGLWGHAMLESSPRASPISIAYLHPGQALMTTVQTTIEAILERGVAVREKACMLSVPSNPRRKTRKQVAAAAAAAAASTAEGSSMEGEQEASGSTSGDATLHSANAELNDLEMATKGEITADELRRRELTRAIVGSSKDRFCSMHVMRFVGELYQRRVLDFETFQAWLDRTLFQTVHLGIPSRFELEASCTLLATAGAALEQASRLAGCCQVSQGPKAQPVPQCGLGTDDMAPRTPQRLESMPTSSSLPILSLQLSSLSSPTNVTAARRVDGAPPSHWINESPQALRKSVMARWSPRASFQALSSSQSLPSSRVTSPTNAFAPLSLAPAIMSRQVSLPGKVPASAPPTSLTFETCCNAIEHITLKAAMARISELSSIPEFGTQSRGICEWLLFTRANDWSVPSGPPAAHTLLGPPGLTPPPRRSSSSRGSAARAHALPASD
ncbi:hypothetical protein IE81DRAFT_77830 [Ceraceosorus guamensis]|uniref:Uncharacterized protein n=1 Tax=Ceraceosorus guamensis TaxID=1522189 RepID=A0A316W121_9BASI|nr:hypothetical protein IE81DRAFT_77830 [Ceraceosorus guamensis]PWN43546.1 hypothetical protein IE81DRAFT_77830 [Ceraceosorus guamensis]